MSVTRVILLRHGETTWNIEGRYQGQLDSPLTSVGVAQAQSLARRLAGAKFTALYSSDLGRALETAKCIAEISGHEVRADARLRERHLGIFQNLLKADFKQKFPEEYRLFKSGGPDYVIPQGESGRQAAERSNACLDELARRHAGETIVVVAHGGTISALLRHTLGIPLGTPRRFGRRNASWNVFLWDDGKWLLETWGDVSHLEGMG
ncbi:MAG TPA: histidine phosphatase family protein [Verrucomicrobiae bacterium]|nr:histidine phosphatase family protein [Verrucomicrobiae bacterium]